MTLEPATLQEMDRFIVDSALPDAKEPAIPRQQGRVGRMARGIALALGIYAFIVALELLKQGAVVYGRPLLGWLHATDISGSLGLGWLLAYAFMSGSPVAAVAVSLFAGGSLNTLQTFAMITGSRLGASFVVLFVGFVYYLRGHGRAASLAIGVLTLLTTAAIYLPALPIGLWLLGSGVLAPIQIAAPAPLLSVIDLLVDPLAGLIGGWLPAWALLPAGVGLLLGALALVDHGLPPIDPQRSRFWRGARAGDSPLAMFLLGAAITSVTLSVSVSLTMLVPLAAKGVVRRDRTIPYIMGANITTFIDTLIAALIAGGPPAFTIVFTEMACVALISLLVLLFVYRPFARVLLATQNYITNHRRTLLLFLGVLLLAPLVLLVV